jgi:hypothetical protein
MAHAESNRSPVRTGDAETPAPARSAYSSPRLLKLDLTATQGSTGGSTDGIAGGSIPLA